MRVVIGELDASKGQKALQDAEVEVNHPIELDFPTPAKTMRVALVRDNKKLVLVLLFKS